MRVGSLVALVLAVLLGLPLLLSAPALAQGAPLLAQASPAGETASALAGTAELDAPPPVRRPWLNPWLFVALPVVVFGGLFAWREGVGRTLVLLPLLLLLYSGLYFLVRFRPEWLLGFGVLAAAPLVLLLTPAPAPSPAPARRGVRAPTPAGLGVTGFGPPGALAADGLGGKG